MLIVKRENDVDTIGGRIRECRIALGISQETLGNMLMIKKATISAYENNKNDAPGKIVVELANALETTTDYLLCGMFGEEDPAIQSAVLILRGLKNPVAKKAALLHLRAVRELENI